MTINATTLSTLPIEKLTDFSETADTILMIGFMHNKKIDLKQLRILKQIELAISEKEL